MIQELKKIQVVWELDPAGLSRLGHVSIEKLNQYLQMRPSDQEELPSVPLGLENAVPLISVFRNLQRLRPELEDQREWLQTPNPLLGERTPVEIMLQSPEHLAWVSYTLDSAVRQDDL